MKRHLRIFVFVILILNFAGNLNTVWADGAKQNGLKTKAPMFQLPDLERLGEDVELFLAPKSEKPKVKFSHAYERLIEAKDLWVQDQDEQAKERLNEALAEFRTGVELGKKTIVESPEYQDTQLILNK